MSYIIEQKWSPTRRVFLKQWTIRDERSRRIIHTARSYAGAVKWLRNRK